jgi:hypothetical protein
MDNEKSIVIYSRVPERSPLPYESILDVGSFVIELRMTSERASELVSKEPHLYAWRRQDLNFLLQDR